MTSQQYVQCGDGIMRDSHRSISEIKVVGERSVNDFSTLSAIWKVE